MNVNESRNSKKVTLFRLKKGGNLFDDKFGIKRQ